MKKSALMRLLYGLLLFVGAGIYSLAIFLLKSDFTVGNWICYVSVILSFLLMFLDIWMPGDKYRKFALFGYTFTRHIVFFWLIQLILFGILLMPLNFIDWKILLICELSAWFFLAGKLLFLYIHKNVYQESVERIDNKVNYINELCMFLDSALDFVPAQYAKSFRRLLEDVKYSIPTSLPEFAVEENLLKEEIISLCDAIKNGDVENLDIKIRHASDSVKNRNARCKITVKG